MDLEQLKYQTTMTLLETLPSDTMTIYFEEIEADILEQQLVEEQQREQEPAA